MKVSHLFINGRVQGVGFRYFVYHSALRHDIRGFVRNLSNGGVEVYAEGDDEPMAAFVREARTGPRMSLVQSVTEDHTPMLHASFNSFEILGDE